MRKILIANDLLTGGGVENVLYNLVRYLLQHEYDITLMIPECSTNEVSVVFGDRVKMYPTMRTMKMLKRFSLGWFWDRGLFVIQYFIYRIRFWFQKYDVLIALKEGPTMREIAKLYGSQKYAWIHVDYNYLHWTKTCFKSSEHELKCMKKYDNVVCVSEAAKNSVIQTIGDPGNLCVKYNPINVLEIQERAKESCAVESNELFTFVSVGRLSVQKNYDLLLDVCSSLEKKYQFVLWIIGDGPLRNQLEEKIEFKSIKSVKLLGSQNNPYPFISRADVFVSSSVCESFGLAVQEALVLGKPVVAVKCPAIEETLDSKYGMLIDNDFHALYMAMEQMIINNDIRLQYEINIKKLFNTQEFYDGRLKKICGLWE